MYIGRGRAGHPVYIHDCLGPVKPFLSALPSPLLTKGGQGGYPHALLLRMYYVHTERVRTRGVQGGNR